MQNTMRYRRAIIPGGTFFFTVVTEQRRPLLQQPAAVGCLRGAFRAVMKQRPFRIDAVAILPDHLHCIWTMPQDDSDYATRWLLVKTWCTKHWPDPVPDAPDPARAARGEHALWQRRYWEHAIRDDLDFARHFDDVHDNPVKHGYVSRPADWPYSSVRRAVEMGVYAEDWTCAPEELDGVGHE